MSHIILQYVLTVLLIIGLSYFIYLLKDKGINIEEDYFGIAYTILEFLTSNEATPHNVKKILRIISSVVKYVENNYKDEHNNIKEDKATVLAREKIESLGFQKSIEDESLRSLIRIGAAMLPPTTKNLDNKIRK